MSVIMIPDAPHLDDMDIEKKALVPGVKLRDFKEADTHRIPDEAWAEADAIVLWHFGAMDQATIAKLSSKCRIIVRAGVGFDGVDVTAAAKRGIPVSNTPDYGTAEVADHAVSLALALIRGLVPYTQRLKADPVGGWDWKPPAVPGRRIRGAKVGIIGLGRIGLAAARRFAGFDTEVAFFDPYQPVGYEQATGFKRYHSLEEMLAVSDIVSVHTPLNDETRFMINAKVVAAMKPGVVYVNTARGGVQDIDAIYGGLTSGRISGAGLDVLFMQEPPPAHPLLADYSAGKFEGRLILTPHAAFYSPDALYDMRYKSVETAVMYLTKNQLRACVNGRELRAAGHDIKGAG